MVNLLLNGFESNHFALPYRDNGKTKFG
jgi:hypothetical protein